MSIFMDICHWDIAKELCRELNTNVLLFTVDGFVVLGNIQQVDGRVVILTPANITGVTSVEILTPGGALVYENYTYIDICTIVAKATGLTTNPFD